MGWSLFGIVFCWQMPHAMAIAWLYRRQFADANVLVATVVDPSGRIAGWFAISGAILLLPIGLAPVIYAQMGWIYGITAALLGLGYFFFSFAFYRNREDAAARRLLWASLVYLPLILILLVAARKI
jgi:heme o synthase